MSYAICAINFVITALVLRYLGAPPWAYIGFAWIAGDITFYYYQMRATVRGY